MRIQDAIRTATRGLKSSLLRSILTMLGIVIGISSVILLMSIGASAQQLILHQVEGIGSNLVFIIPGATKGSRLASPPSVQGVIIKTLVEADARALRADPTIRAVAPEVRGQGRVVYGNNDTSITYEGTVPDFFALRNFSFAAGGPFTMSDVDSLSRVALLGSGIAETLFGTKNPIGETVRLKDVSFRVVGVLEEQGVGPFGVDQDNQIFIPLSVAQKQLLGIDFYNVITIEANSDYTIDFVQNRITSIMRHNHRITDPDKDDFTIRTQADALSLLGSITSIMKVFLTSIASISLIVGGIGIMNIMLVSVIERTREIGLRKSIGATNRDILEQFLIESVMLTLLGGIIGIVLGIGLAAIIGLVLIQVVDGWTIQLPLSAMVLAVAVSSLTGVLFGIYPARQAARKNPIEALRYE